ncbi:hypothetical protein HPB51_005005 [Rhipicephalus microplus]|uniref:Uncharacterized protein n=1 Tax=Rhipicephalus microplus TaxID=6941 RepID=A0A9J6EEW5_RHIMP|nr:hypothetical protein HPB51_005005 [Rhipicephalus microplus]
MDLERCLKEQGLTWTWEQIRTCWKNSKKRFMAERLLLCKSGGKPSKWKWFDKMSLLLGDCPMVQARDYGVDTAAEDDEIVLLCARFDYEALCRKRTTAAIALCSVSQDTNTTIKYSWCKLRKNTKTAIAVAERQLRKQSQPTAARGESAGLEERKPVPEDGLSARLDVKRRCDHRSPQLVRASSYKLGCVEASMRARLTQTTQRRHRAAVPFRHAHTATVAAIGAFLSGESDAMRGDVTRPWLQPRAAAPDLMRMTRPSGDPTGGF